MRRRSPASWVTVAAAGVVLVTVAVAGGGDRSPDAARPSTSEGSRTYGLLAPTSEQLGILPDGGLEVVTVGPAWATVQPSADHFDDRALASMVEQVRQAESRRLDVVLDLGLQYPPSWVFDLPGATRFVNQYGQAWHGSSSQDVPNAVFNSAVRIAQARYVDRLGEALRSVPLSGVRIGGLGSGELRYPPTHTTGHDDSLWAFDADALADSPDPSWRPGTGSEDTARQVLTWYLGRLTDYLAFQLDTVGAALPGVAQQVLLPSWGLRPGMLDQAVRTRFGEDTPADVTDLVGAGLDWSDQVALVAGRPPGVTVYTTWLDAPDNGDSPRTESPVAYLASLAGPAGLPLGGENTGGGGTAAWSRTLAQAERFGLRTVMFMSGELLTDGQAGLTFSQLVAAVAHRR